jgi:hypothetical protein
MDLFAQDKESSAVFNQTFFEKLASNDAGHRKEAAESINAYTRTRMREDSFLDRIMPAQDIANEDLTRQVHTDKPMVVIDREGDSPAAISVPFATQPTNFYIRFPRYVCSFERIQTPRFTKDVAELRTWTMDVRQVISDNAIKDMLAEKDGKFLLAVNTALRGAGLTVPATGAVQYKQIVGGIDRNSLADMLKIMPSTPFHLEAHTCLTNVITNKELWKFGRDEMGGDKSQDIMVNGWSMETFMGKRWLFTLKTELVPNGAVFMFSDPRFIGKHFQLEAPTMFIRQEAFMLEFFSYENSGATLGHIAGLARADFAGVV